jgi:hypothetical protein
MKRVLFIIGFLLLVGFAFGQDANIGVADSYALSGTSISNADISNYSMLAVSDEDTDNWRNVGLAMMLGGGVAMVVGIFYYDIGVIIFPVGAISLVGGAGIFIWTMF